MLAACAVPGPETDAGAIKPDSFTRLAAAARDNGDYQTAASLYQKAAAARPTDPAPQKGLGDALLAAGSLDEAGKAYEKALLLAPGRGDLHLALGRLYLLKRKPNQALIEFD